MNIPEATPEQIEAFEKGAAARYAELGVPTELAQALYAQQMNKEAAQMGMTPPKPEPEKVTKIASELAQVMGKTRVAKKQD